jgi:acylglycerol lipase
MADTVQHTEGRFIGGGSTELYYQSWKPIGRPQASVAMAHGFGEHGGRYLNLVKHLVPHGYAVYALDHRGHGRSPGKRGHINRWNEYRDDVRGFIGLIRHHEPNLPVFLLGHSLGGLIALEYVLRDPDGLKGVIASGPLLVQARISPAIIAVARILSRLMPSLAIKTGLDAAALSRDPAVVKEYQEDPLVHSYGTPRLSTEITAAQRWTNAHAADINLPIMMILGGQDKLVSPEGGRKFFAHVTFADKELKEYPDAYHEPHNDVIADHVIWDVRRWLEAHLA